jgi:hypothetical protein
MAARPPSAPARQRQRAGRVPRPAARAILNAIMTLAVVVLERRIRKALRAGAGASPRPG